MRDHFNNRDMNYETFHYNASSKLDMIEKNVPENVNRTRTY